MCVIKSSEKLNRISEQDFENHKNFKKLTKQVDTCLVLIERLSQKAKDISISLEKQLPEPPVNAVDPRINQFAYIINTLASIHFNCTALSQSFPIITKMNQRGINGSIGGILENQRSYITFNAIVKFVSILEYTRKSFIITKPSGSSKFYENIEKEYGTEAVSYNLLRNFRNCIHSNAFWHGNQPLVYHIRDEGKVTINPGDSFKYNHWLLYRLFLDSIRLHEKFALNSEAPKVWKTNLSLGNPPNYDHIKFFETSTYYRTTHNKG